MDKLEKRLLTLAYDKNQPYPLNYIDQNVLVDFILGAGVKRPIVIHPEDVTIANSPSDAATAEDIRVVGEHIAKTTEIVQPLFEETMRRLLLEELAK